MLKTYRYSHDDLGATYSHQATTLKLWAPTALKVEVILFPNATGTSLSTTAMTAVHNGIWSTKLEGDLDGKYYWVFTPASG